MHAHRQLRRVQIEYGPARKFALGVHAKRLQCGRIREDEVSVDVLREHGIRNGIDKRAQQRVFLCQCHARADFALPRLLNAIEHHADAH